jgi:hypothetical protein
MGSLLAQCIRSRWGTAACLAVVLLALVLPPKRGFGLPLCQFKSMTGYPCLSCGMTRSFIDMAHLNVPRAAFFHPVGVVLFPLILFIGALTFAPPRVRQSVAVWAEKHGFLLNCLGAVLLFVFLSYGVGRMVWLAVTERPSPW